MGQWEIIDGKNVIIEKEGCMNKELDNIYLACADQNDNIVSIANLPDK